jgi:hypothetical protein
MRPTATAIARIVQRASSDRLIPRANWADPNSTNITSVQTDRRTSQTVARGVSGRMAMGGTR